MNICSTSVLRTPNYSETPWQVCCCHYRQAIENAHGIPQYTSCNYTKEDTLNNDMSVLCSFGTSTKHETSYIPIDYWIPNGLQLLFANYYHLFFQLSKQDFRVTVTSGTPGLVRIKRMHKIKISLLMQQH
jgi:hypothetical protein